MYNGRVLIHPTSKFLKFDMNKTKKLTTTILFVFACAIAWALPGTGTANLQTTPGVTTNVSGNTLSIAAPNKSILVWQNFGNGTDTIALGDTVNYSLPSSNSSVLNIVNGTTRTTIDGSITSNGNVYVLNPSGIIVGSGARIDANSVYLSTSDNTGLASLYFQNNGKLPSQDGTVLANGNTTIVSGAVIAVTDSISLVSRNVDIGALISQGNLNINADGTVTVGSAGTSYVTGSVSITNPTGITTLGAPGATFIASNNLTVNSTTGTVTNSNSTNLNARNLTVNVGTGDVMIGKAVTNNVTAVGNNINVAITASGTATFNGSGNGTIVVTAPGALSVSTLNNTGAGTTSVTAGGALALGSVSINSGSLTTFTGTVVTDTKPNVFVYGPVSFTATAGDIAITSTGHSFGPVSVTTAGNAIVNESAALNINRITAAKFVANSNEFVFQTPITGVINSPSVNVTSNGNVTLTAANNIGNITATGSNINIANNAALVLSNVNATGNLTVTSTAPITQAIDTKVSSYGNTSFTSTGLTIANAGNQFGALSVDVTATGVASVAEDTTLNLVALRAASVTLKSLASVITSGTASILADNYNIIASKDFAPAANFRATNAISVLAGGSVDLSLLNSTVNLNNKSPSIIATSYKSPTP